MSRREQQVWAVVFALACVYTATIAGHGFATWIATGGRNYLALGVGGSMCWYCSFRVMALYAMGGEL